MFTIARFPLSFCAGLRVSCCVSLLLPVFFASSAWAQTGVVTPSDTHSSAQHEQQSSENSQSSAVAELLQKMASVPHTLNYKGSFTYQHKDNPALQSYRILHWVENGVEHERLQQLNGTEREFLRSGKAIGCETLGDQLLQGKVSQLGANIARLDQLYRFEIRGPERVAGRDATALLALPVDGFRHSLLLTIDNETGLVLKSWLVDESARALERYQFIDLELNPDITSLQQQPAAQTQRSTISQLSECNPAQLKQPEHWLIDWVPSGFAFVGQRKVRNQIEMLMYTDGLTTFSVFIEPTDAAIPEGVAQRGATLAVMDSLSIQGKNYRITVVGEIPVVTAQKIAQNIKGR
ncbi:MucB/RseB C-terminal domain-containing protein [Cellvibrio sp. pealriver]|uniref:MucB/RseB C-terminal domain-containing protein n=1 Tax=Cellvibrio sp. pealriver TaxID=1622269 RepID=UPI0009E5899D|nr:MucB/RseB C-terminal domain-containing protein [Cellvibrio sp. pealriver]